MLFSPEREPFTLAVGPYIPKQLLVCLGLVFVLRLQPIWWGRWRFGAMVDTRQVHKLPLEWLLVLSSATSL
jgi:hypothetical protein